MVVLVVVLFFYDNRDNYAPTTNKSTPITTKNEKQQTRATTVGDIPSSMNIGFLESNNIPYIKGGYRTPPI